MAIVSPTSSDLSLKLPLLSKRATMIAVPVLVAAAFAPLLWSHLGQLWARPHYQFFPIVFVGAAVLAWKELRHPASFQPDKTWKSWGLLAWSWILLATAELLGSSWLSAVAFLFVLLAAVFAVGGSSLLRQLLPAWLFLWLTIPPPFGVDYMLVQALQRLTTQWSSSVLDLFRIYHVIAGNVVEIGPRRFFVAEACAGINSLFSILACGLFYLLYTRPSVLRAILLIVSAMAWVLLANVARIVLVVWFAKQWGIDVAEGWRHDVLGFALFAVALALIWSTDRLLLAIAPSRITPDDPPGGNLPVPEKTPEEEYRGLMESQLAETWLNSRLVGAAFGLLLLSHVLLGNIPHASSAMTAIDGAPDPARLNKQSLPEQIDGWKQGAFTEERRNPGSAFGEYSKIWKYHGNFQQATFAVDYPFSDWHDLQVCYSNQGWEVEEIRQRISREQGTPGFYCVTSLKKSGLRRAYLFYCEFDQAGRVVEPSGEGLRGSLARHKSALKRLQSWGGQTAESERLQVGTLIQFQMLVESTSRLSDAELDKARDRFFLAFRTLHDH
jgi:exosortase